MKLSKSLVLGSLLVGLAGTATAQPTTAPNAGSGDAAKPAPPPAPAGLPAVGADLPVNGGLGWGKLDWLYDVPAFTDAAGKVVIHWFCGPKVQACVDDLARLTTLKESSNRVYVIAYINGTKRDATKLDPIRESEGVGRGTVAYGKGLMAFFKKHKLAVPASLVVGVDGKVAYVSTGGAPGELDARDAKINALAAAIKEYTAAVEGPKSVAANQKFDLSISIKLASWLVYSKKPGTTLNFQATVPKEIKCDNTVLKGDQLKPSEQTLTAKITCSGPKGSYEARGQINFSYDTPSGATGIGTDGAVWKFEIK